MRRLLPGFSERDRLRQRAWDAVSAAIKAGKIPHPQSLQCFDCDNPAYAYEHRDYRKPLDVQPVCQGCNNRRGPALPAIGANDGLRHKRPEIEGITNIGERWSKMEGGEGYSPLESVCHVDVNAYECWWLEDGRQANGWDPDAYARVISRWDFFKRHDSYALDGGFFA